MRIIKIMADNNIDSFDEACERAAILLDENSKKFKALVDAEAERRYKGRFMTQLDKTRAKIKEEGYKEGYLVGYKDAKKIEHFCVPCSRCGRSMLFTSTDKDWAEVKPTLYKAFRYWHHTDCPDKGFSVILRLNFR